MNNFQLIPSKDSFHVFSFFRKQLNLSDSSTGSILSIVLHLCLAQKGLKKAKSLLQTSNILRASACTNHLRRSVETPKAVEVGFIEGFLNINLTRGCNLNEKKVLYFMYLTS